MIVLHADSLDRADHGENTDGETEDDSSGDPEWVKKEGERLQVSTAMNGLIEKTLDVHHLQIPRTSLDGTAEEANHTSHKDRPLSPELVSEVARCEGADKSSACEDGDDG